MATQIAQDKSAKQVHAERAEYITKEYGELVGKTIARVRPLTPEECSDLAWDYTYEREAFVIFFTDGTAVIPMRDPEGNGPGHILIADSEEK